MTPDMALAACRFVQACALMLIWGSGAYLSALVPGVLAARIAGELRFVRWAALVLALLSAGLRLPIESASIGDGWADAIAATSLRSVLFDTNVGTAWLVQAAASLLMACAVLTPERVRGPALACLAALVLASLTLTGHASMHEGVFGLAHRSNDALHLLAGGAWLGALAPLLPILRDLDDPACHRDAVLALRRFSSAGHLAVALVVATGLANTAMVLDGWPTDWTRPYLLLLGAKIGLVALMTALALYNRYGLVPRLRHDHATAIRWLRLGTVAELALGAGVVAAVSLFGLMEPS